MFNKEKFHNELAMRLGYERIVNNKSILISVEESYDPWVTLQVQGRGDIRFKASGNSNEENFEVLPENQTELKEIVDIVHQTYREANKSYF